MRKFVSTLILTTVFAVGHVSIANANPIQNDCEELGALVFVGSLERGMDPIDAYDLASWARQDCENGYQ